MNRLIFLLEKLKLTRPLKERSARGEGYSLADMLIDDIKKDIFRRRK